MIDLIKTIRDILLLAHRQAFCWTDEWYDLSYEKIVEFEQETYNRTNEKVMTAISPIVNNTCINNSINNNKDLCDFD